MRARRAELPLSRAPRAGAGPLARCRAGAVRSRLPGEHAVRRCADGANRRRANGGRSPRRYRKGPRVDVLVRGPVRTRCRAHAPADQSASRHGGVLHGTGALIMRVAFVSPLPPSKTGVADYSAALLEPLRGLADVEVFADAERTFDPARYDVALYQIGNNPYHAFAYETAVRHPGVVVMHEANLH